MKIFKYEIPPYDHVVEIPNGARILSVGVQTGSIMLWALVDPNELPIKRVFPVIATGDKMADHNLPFIGTVFMGPLVWHVFDGGPVDRRNKTMFYLYDKAKTHSGNLLACVGYWDTEAEALAVKATEELCWADEGIVYEITTTLLPDGDLSCEYSFIQERVSK